MGGRLCSISVTLGGVHWLTLGKLTDRNGEVDGAKLLSKLLALILRLDSSNFNPQLPSVEAAKNYLQKVMGRVIHSSCNEYHKCTLIFDPLHLFVIPCI